VGVRVRVRVRVCVVCVWCVCGVQKPTLKIEYKIYFI